MQQIATQNHRFAAQAIRQYFIVVGQLLQPGVGLRVLPELRHGLWRRAVRFAEQNVERNDRSALGVQPLYQLRNPGAWPGPLAVGF